MIKRKTDRQKSSNRGRQMDKDEMDPQKKMIKQKIKVNTSTLKMEKSYKKKHS